MTAQNFRIATYRAVTDRAYRTPLKQRGLRWTIRNAEVVVGELCRDPAPRRTLKESDLQQVRFVHVFDRIDFLAQDGGDRVHTDGTSAEAFDDRAKQLAIDVVKPVLIDVQKF